MKLHVFQKTKDGDYVKPYLVDGKSVYSYNKHGKLVIKKINDFFTKVKNEVPVISVEKNEDFIIPEDKMPIEDDSFYEEPIKEPVEEVASEPEVQEETTSDNVEDYDDDLMNINISTDVEKEEPEEETKKESKVIITENDPYGDYF